MAAPKISLGQQIIDGLTVRDLDGNPLTGATVPATVTLVLKRKSGNALVSSAETITWTEIGTTGSYVFTFTPAALGLYLLTATEVGATTLGQKNEFWYDMVAGAIFDPAFTGAFCSLSDMERWTNTSISATSSPDDNAASQFAVARANMLMSLCASLGLAVTPSTVVIGTRIESLLRTANAIGAVLDYTVAQQSKSPNFSEKVDRLQALWEQFVGSIALKIVGFIPSEITGNLVSLATDFIISGDTIAAPTGGAPFNAAIGISMGDLF